jgi:hypothetical protein
VDPQGRETRQGAQVILSQPEVLALSPKVDRPPSYIPKAVFVRAAMNAKLATHRSQAEWEELFDATMDRATGWYKRRLQVISTLVAIGLTVVANADTVQIADRLARSPTLRAQFVAAAEQRVRNTPRPASTQANYTNADEPVTPDSTAPVTSAERVGSESDSDSTTGER